MKKDELHAKLDKLYEKSEEIKSKIDIAKDEKKEDLECKLAETKLNVAAVKEKIRKATAEVVADVKGDIVAAREDLRDAAGQGESKINAGMLKLQMTVEKVQDDIQAAKEQLDEKRMAKLVDKLDDCAADAIDVAMCAMDEAIYAVLEAAKAHADYDAQYGAR